MFTNKNVISFYEKNKGNRLVLQSNFPFEIKKFLKNEEILVSNTLLEYKYKSLLECGCMDARNLDIASRNNIYYYGIDISQNYIIRANKKIKSYGLKDKAFAELACASEISIQKNSTLSCLPKPILGFFPFNSFGNMAEPKNVLKNFSEMNIDFIISTYKTDELSNNIREEYYKNCNFSNLIMQEDHEKVIFIANEGLRTFAYKEEYILDILKALNFKVRVFNFSSIGIAYYIYT